MIRYRALTMLTLLFSAAVAAQAQAPAGDPARGRDKTRMCEGCHGIEGWRTAFPEVYHVPKLGGQHAAYIMQALREYKSGDRSHPSMQAIAGGPQTATASK
jgi:cytochrome c553